MADWGTAYSIPAAIQTSFTMTEEVVLEEEESRFTRVAAEGSTASKPPLQETVRKVGLERVC